MRSLLGKHWNEKISFSKQKSLLEHYLLSYQKTMEDISPSVFSDFLDPFLFQDAHKAVQIITNVIENNHRIMVFGDYDLDGMSGTAQLYLTLKHLGGNVSYRLPSRSDGYGLSESFIHEAHEKNVRLFITTDCGVSNRSEIQVAKDLGMKVIITDHHSIPDHLPPADALLHPLLSSESFPDKDLTGAGVAWYLCRALLIADAKKNKKPSTEAFQKQLLEIAVLGTVADCGPLRGENRKIVQQGLECLKTTQNPGLKNLFTLSKTSPEHITAETIGFFLAPRLNASGRLSHPTLSLELLLGNADRAPELELLNTKRQEMVEVFLEEAFAQLTLSDSALLVQGKNWPGGVIGLISGRLSERFGKPSIAFEVKPGKITGSCRGPQDFHIAHALKELKKEHPEWFFGCGGHAAAAGLSLYPEYFDDFCTAYKNLVQKKRGINPSPPSIDYCGEVCRPLTLSEIQDLSKAEPFGVQSPFPVFLFPDMKVLKKRCVGNNSQHLSLFLSCTWSNQTFSAIWFRGAEYSEFLHEQQSLSLLARPEIHEWKKQVSISLKVLDISV